MLDNQKSSAFNGLKYQLVAFVDYGWSTGHLLFYLPRTRNHGFHLPHFALW